MKNIKADHLTIGVVLVNWNGGEFTIPCVKSLYAGTLKPDQVVVIDNASQDGSPKKILEECPGIKIIINESNRGFSGANNQGIEYLLENNFDYIWILNNDTVVAADCLQILAETAAGTSNASGFSAKIW